MVVGSPATGAAAALLAPLCGALGLFIWGEAWKGHAYMLNTVKCSIAGAVFVAATLLTQASHTAPVGAEIAAWLLFSSFIGIVVGDNAWLQSLQILGARKVILVDAIKPFVAGLLGYAVLGEPVTAGLILGMVITTAGVLAVSLEKRKGGGEGGGEAASADVEMTAGTAEEGAGGEEDAAQEEETERLVAGGGGGEEDEEHEGGGGRTSKGAGRGHAAPPPPRYSQAVGYSLAAGNVILDVWGALITKQHARALSTWQVNTIRFGGAAVMLATFAVAARILRVLRGGGSRDSLGLTERKRGGVDWATLPHHMPARSWGVVVAGVMMTTFLAPALSNYALFLVALPVLSTLGSIGPVYSLPLALAIRGEAITPRAALGSALAVCGVLPLYLAQK